MTDTVKINLYPEGAPEKALRTIALGVAPMILLEIDFAAGTPEDADLDDIESTMTFSGSLIETPEELLEVLESFIEVLRGALERIEGNSK